MVGHLAGGGALSTELFETLVARTDGVPLFVEELTRALVESDAVPRARCRGACATR